MKKRKGGRKMKSIISREIARKEGWFSSQWIFFALLFVLVPLSERTKASLRLRRCLNPRTPSRMRSSLRDEEPRSCSTEAWSSGSPSSTANAGTAGSPIRRRSPRGQTFKEKRIFDDNFCFSRVTEQKGSHHPPGRVSVKP